MSNSYNYKSAAKRSYRLPSPRRSREERAEIPFKKLRMDDPREVSAAFSRKRETEDHWSRHKKTPETEEWLKARFEKVHRGRSVQQGRHFTDGVEALEFVKRNPTEDLFIECGLGKSIFLVDLCYDLAETGKRVLLVIVENSVRSYESKFHKQAEGHPKRMEMLRRNSVGVNMVRDEYNSEESLLRKKICVGYTEDRLLDQITSGRYLQDLFDVVIIDQLQKTKPADLRTFMNRGKKQIIGAYKLEDDSALPYSALEYVRGHEEKLNILKMSNTEQYRCKSAPAPEAPIARSREDRKQLERLKEAAEKFDDGYECSDTEDAMNYIMGNRLENLFIRAGAKLNSFLVQACYELADAGKKVVFLYDQRRIYTSRGDLKKPEDIQKKWKFEFGRQAKNDLEEDSIGDLEAVNTGKQSLRKALKGKTILMGSLDQKWFHDLLMRKLIKHKKFVPDVIIISSLEWTEPKPFLKFLKKKIRVIGSYSLDVKGKDGINAVEFVRGNEHRLNRFLLDRDSR